MKIVDIVEKAQSIAVGALTAHEQASVDYAKALYDQLIHGDIPTLVQMLEEEKARLV